MLKHEAELIIYAYFNLDFVDFVDNVQKMAINFEEKLTCIFYFLLKYFWISYTMRYFLHTSFYLFIYPVCSYPSQYFYLSFLYLGIIFSAHDQLSLWVFIFTSLLISINPADSGISQTLHIFEILLVVTSLLVYSNGFNSFFALSSIHVEKSISIYLNIYQQV